MQTSGPVPLTASIVDTLVWRAGHEPDRRSVTFLRDDGLTETHLTYGELFAQASAVAAELHRRDANGERVLLLYPPGEAYVVAIYGCLLAGAVAIPAYPPRNSARAVARVSGIVADARPAVALTTRALESSLPPLDGVAVIATDAGLPAAPATWHPVCPAPGSLAVLQYTSGSTRTPRGVMVTHGNLQHNISLISGGFRMSADDRGVIWLPSYHDMGLIGGVLVPPSVGIPVVLMAPGTFIQRPIRWLQTIARHRGTISGGPNFAFDLCVARTTADERKTLDLSSWRVAFTGAEPIRADTLDRFADAFAVSGFRREAFYPCYGLAEATLMVSGGAGPAVPIVKRMNTSALREQRAVEAPDGDASARAFVGCGRAMADTTIAIVRPDTRRRCAPGEIGEIWMAGPSRAQGYWNAPEETRRVFEARIADGATTAESAEVFLRTGDLGFLVGEELFVTGRLKDLLVLHGRNHYPPDIEWTVERSHAALEPNAVAAFSIEADGEERLVIVQELTRRAVRELAGADVDGGQAVLRAIRDAVACDHELPVHAVLLVKPLAIPRTSSGKIQRYRCRQAYLEGMFEPVARWDAGSREAGYRAASATFASVDRLPGSQAIEQWLVSHIAGVTGLAPDEIDRDRPFAYLGLSSLQAVGLTSLLEQELQRPLSATLAYDYPTIATLSRHLAGEPEPSRPAALESGRTADWEPVAIIGLACRLPCAPDVESFWRLLSEGVDGTTEIPADRRSRFEAYERAAARTHGSVPLRGGFLPVVDEFDPGFFGILPREAASIDPQQRLLLELASEALDDAGQPREALRGSRTGVFVGIASNDYSRMVQEHPDRVDPYAGTGNAQSIAANRISYVFDLRGPSLAVDTACSSSLVALHLACESLRAGDCGTALVGGVNLVLAPSVTASFAKAGFLAPDGRCKAFDARADGYARGEGGAVVVLKPLARALADGDRVYAIVRGSAVNSDGRSNGLTAPSRHAQEDVLREAYARAHVDPGRVQYVEAHGTGTSLGDPIEVESLANVVGSGRRSGDACAIGSVKTNIGHLEAAAGIAGLLKTVLALDREEIPPSLHFETANPHIPFDRLALRVQHTRVAWPRNGETRIAGVSSFGFGGTNAHVVLEEAPYVTRPAGADQDLPGPDLLTVSAASVEALRTLAEGYAGYLDGASVPLSAPGIAHRIVSNDRPAWRDICYTAAVRRTHHEYRLAVLADDPAAAADALRAFVRGERAAGLLAGRAIRGHAPAGTGDGVHGDARDRRSLLEALAAAYIEGRSIVWRAAFPSGGRIVALPGHPWRRQRYWIDTTHAWPAGPGGPAATGQSTHPLLGRPLDIAPSASRVWEGEINTERFAYFRDHRFQGTALVPGTTYIELAVAAAIEAFGPTPLVLTKVEFQSPMVLSDGSALRTQVVLSTPPSAQPPDRSDRADRAEFRVFSRPIAAGGGDNAWTLHAVGEIARETDADDVAHKEQSGILTESDRAALQERCSAQLTGDEYFAELSGRGFDYGPAFRGLRFVWRRAGEALGRLEVPESLQHDISAYHLHPALLDAGAQLLVATDQGAGRAFLPAGVDRVRVIPSAGQPVWGCASYRAAKVGGLPGFHGDVRLFDNGGALVAEAIGLKVQYLDTEPRTADGDDRQDPPAWTRWLYELQWEATPADEASARPATGVWLILADAGGVGEGLSAALRATGNTCLVARPGDDFARLGDGSFRVRPTHADDLSELLDAALTSQAGALRGVVHMWSLDAGSMTDADVSSMRPADSTATAIAIVQALATRTGDPGRLWIVTRGAQRVADRPSAPEAIQAPLWGLGRTLFQEHPSLAGALIDLDSVSGMDAAAADLIRALATRDGETQMAFRGRIRYVPRLVRLHLPEAVEPQGGAHAPEAALGETNTTGDRVGLARGSLRADASYLITGGLGGLGLLVAGWMVEHGARHLVLVGRAQIPPRAEWDSVARGTRVAEQVAAVRALEAGGAAIEVASVDVSDETELRAALDRLAAAGVPAIRGVVHAAGVVHDEILLRVNAGTLDAVLRAKVIGGAVLDRYFAGADLDFFVMFSSAASLTGSAGQGTYAAANAFLDALAHRRHGLGRPALSINWGPWSGTGMAADTEAEARLAARGVGSIPPAAGLEIFGRLLRTSASQVGVVAMDWGRLEHSFPDLVRSPVFGRLLREEPGVTASTSPAIGLDAAGRGSVLRDTVLATPAADRPALVASMLRDEVAAVSGLAAADIDLQRPLDELGIDSLTSMELKSRLERTFEIAIPIVRLLEFPTLTRLATLVTDSLAAKDGPARTSAPTAVTSPAVRTKIVVTRAAGTEVPLFCVHPGALDADCYTGLAEALGDEQPFYVLQPPELENNQSPTRELAPDVSIERVAASCLDALRAVQPFGPYRLAGWSLGGVVAFEIARQLTAQHESIALLALFDAPPPAAGPQAEWDDVALLRMFAGYLGARRGRHIVLPPNGDSADVEEELQLVTQHAIAADVLPAQTAVDQMRDLYQTYKHGVQAGTHLLRRYRPAAYPGRLTYFRATENRNLPGDELPNASAIWARLAAGLDLHDVPGNHYTLFLDPHARELAVLLKEHL